MVQEQLNPMSPMSPMVDAYGGPRHGYHRNLSIDRRGASPSVLQHRVVAERKWVLGVQVHLNSLLDHSVPLLIDPGRTKFLGAEN